MDRNSPTARNGHRAGIDAEPVFSFIQTGVLDPQPRLLVERLLFARALLQANAVLAPRFVLGECAAAHHIVLGNAAVGFAAADRLMSYGFRVEPSVEPPGIRFFVASWHSEAEIRALLVAIAIVIRELDTAAR